MPSGNTKVKKLARALQERTGWNYQFCHQCVVDRLPEEEIVKLIVTRKPATPRNVD